MERNLYVLLDLAIAQILAITLLTRLCRMHQSSTAILRRPRQEELHKVQEPPGVPTEIGMAEARVEVVDDDFRLAALLGASGELAGGENLEKLGDLVSMTY